MRVNAPVARLKLPAPAENTVPLRRCQRENGPIGCTTGLARKQDGFRSLTGQETGTRHDAPTARPPRRLGSQKRTPGDDQLESAAQQLKRGKYPRVRRTLFGEGRGLDCAGRHDRPEIGLHRRLWMRRVPANLSGLRS